MRRRPVALALACGLLLAARAIPAAGATSLLLNASFEIDDDGDNAPDGWTETVRFRRSSAVPAHEGDFVGRFGGQTNATVAVAQTVSGLQGGGSYQFSGWVKIPRQNDNTFNFRFQIRWLDANDQLLGASKIKKFSKPTSGWTKAAAPVSGPAGTTHAEVRMVATSLNGVIYVDDFVFQ